MCSYTFIYMFPLYHRYALHRVHTIKFFMQFTNCINISSCLNSVILYSFCKFVYFIVFYFVLNLMKNASFCPQKLVIHPIYWYKRQGCLLNYIFIRSPDKLWLKDTYLFLIWDSQNIIGYCEVSSS